MCFCFNKNNSCWQCCIFCVVLSNASFSVCEWRATFRACLAELYIALSLFCVVFNSCCNHLISLDRTANWLSHCAFSYVWSHSGLILIDLLRSIPLMENSLIFSWTQGIHMKYTWLAYQSTFFPCADDRGIHPFIHSTDGCMHAEGMGRHDVTTQQLLYHTLWRI